MLDYSKRITIDPVLELLPGQIFTFGSNESGRHGKGAALTANTRFVSRQRAFGC